MNKISKGVFALFSLFTLVAMVGCGEDVDPTPQPEPAKDKVSFEITNLKYDSVEVTITPESEDVAYFAYLYPDTEEFMGRDDVEIYVDIRYSDYFEQFLSQGTQSLTFQGLIGHSYYKVVYFVVDASKNKVGDVYFSERIATPDAPEVFDIQIADITGLSATLNITPPDNNTSYYFYLYPVADYEQYQHSSDYELMQYDYSFWQYMAAISEKDITEVIAGDLVKGPMSISTDALLYLTEWDTEYLVWAYGLDAQGVPTTTITRRTFTTASPATSSMTFDVQNINVEWYEETTAEGTIRGYMAEAKIIPSNKDERYFATITNKDWYDWYASENNKGRSDEKYIMTQILLNASVPSAEIGAMCHEGDFVYNCFAERKILLRPDREYAVFVFGLDDNGATTGLSVFPFTTGSMPQ